MCINNFSKIYEEWEEKKLIGATNNRKREGKLSMSEKLLIVVLDHLEGFKNFKYYYKYAVEIKYKSLFKKVLCYDRFIQIMPNLLLPLSILLQFLFGEARGIYFLDTTKLSICYSMREKRNKVFGKIAEKGKTTMSNFSLILNLPSLFLFFYCSYQLLLLPFFIYFTEIIYAHI